MRRLDRRRRFVVAREIEQLESARAALLALDKPAPKKRRRTTAKRASTQASKPATAAPPTDEPASPQTTADEDQT